MDFQFSEDTKCNMRKKSCNKLNIFPIYTVAFTVSDVYDKTVISEDSNDLDNPVNYNESASSTTLKNKRSVEITKSIINNAPDITEKPVMQANNTIDVTESPVIQVNNILEVTEKPVIQFHNTIDVTESLVVQANNTIDVTESPAIQVNNIVDVTEKPVIQVNNTIDVTESLVVQANNTIDVTESPVIQVNNILDVTEKPVIQVNNIIDVTEKSVIQVNNTIDVTEEPVIPINNAIDYSVIIGHEHNDNNPTSESILSSIKYIKKPLKSQHTVLSKLKSQPKKCTRLVKIKNTYFKNKNPENIINKKLENYYDRAKNNCTNSGKIQKKIFSDSILNAVSLTRILKKVLAKENLLDDIDKISLNGNHNEDKISYVSESSQHTLTRERSISSDNSEFNNTKTTPSVIDVSNYMPIKNINSNDTRDIKLISSNIGIGVDKMEHPYKTDIIAVAVARIKNASILNYKKETCDANGRENFIIKDSLTSDESYLSQTATESSTASFEMLHNLGKEGHLTTIDINDSGVSSQTLAETQNIFNITSESDQFVIAKTSSYFSNDHVDSNTTLTPAIDLKNESDAQQPKLSTHKLLKSTLLDTIINVSMFPKMTTSIHNDLYNSELKDVIITDELRNSLPLNRLDSGCTNENIYSKSVLKKSCNPDDECIRQKSCNLPNEDTIKELLFNKDQSQKKSCSEEFRNYTPFTDLWDKLTVFLDLAMKRLENAITEKITHEMKKTLDKLDRYINNSVGDSKVSKSETYIKEESQEAHIISTMESGESKSLQCGSIQNNVLDELVKKINREGLKLKAYKSPPLRLKDKSISEDFFEVLKPTLAPSISNEKGNGDSIVASSSEAIEVKYSKLQYMPLFIITIVQIVKENLLVIISVPLFCFALFLIYTFLVMLANI